MNYSLEDQRRDAEKKRRLAEQAVGQRLEDCAAELLGAAEANPHGQLGRIFSPEPAVDLAKRRVPDDSRFQREEEAMLRALESGGSKDSYLDDACKLLPSGPTSEF